VRTWLYRIATRRCLNARRSASRRLAREWDIPGAQPPEPTRLGEAVWLQPFPGALLEGGIGVPPGPEARCEQAESIPLAFVTALQVPAATPARRAHPAAGSPAEKAIVARFCAALFGAGRRTDLIPARANGQPAFGTYLRTPGGIRHGTSLYVVTLAGDQICAMTRFENSTLPPFGLPSVTDLIIAATAELAGTGRQHRGPGLS
jgi:hypothetical protein